MPAKNKIQKTFWLTPAQEKYLKDAGIENLSDYIRRLIKADKPDFPNDMPQKGSYDRDKKEA